MMASMFTGRGACFIRTCRQAFLLLRRIKRAQAADAFAQAQAEIANRGLTVTVTTLYYNAIVAQRENISAQQNLDSATQFLTTTKELEKGGEIPHADVVKAQLQFDQEKIALQEAQLAMERAHLALAVLLSPVLDDNFTAVDDLDNPPALPSVDQVDALAEHANPYIRSAMATLKQTNDDVSIARAGFFPTFTLMRTMALRPTLSPFIARWPPFRKKESSPNLGYFLTAGMNVPTLELGLHGK